MCNSANKTDKRMKSTFRRFILFQVKKKSLSQFFHNVSSNLYRTLVALDEKLKLSFMNATYIVTDLGQTCF